MATRLSTSRECRDAYREVLQGSTYVEEKDLFIKHFKEVDLGLIESKYKGCARRAEKQGLSTKVQKLEFLQEEDYWTEEEEQEYLVMSLAVKDAYIHAAKLHDAEQKKHFEENIIKEQESKLQEIVKERSALLEPTIEGYCEKQLNEFYVYHALYKDQELKTPFFSQEEFDELSFIELADLISLYNKETSKFSEKNIKIIAVNPWFLNSFFMCDDDPVKFFGKNVLDLTMYQMNLFSRGKFYKSVLIEGKEPPEQYFEEDALNGLELAADWYNSAANSINAEREAARARSKSSSRGSTTVRRG